MTPIVGEYPRLTRLGLSWRDADSADPQALADLTSASLRELVFYRTSFSAKAVQDLAASLKSNTRLRRLEIHDHGITQADAEALHRRLPRLNLLTDDVEFLAKP